jgi:hypothetical protein
MINFNLSVFFSAALREQRSSRKAWELVDVLLKKKKKTNKLGREI